MIAVRTILIFLIIPFILSDAIAQNSKSYRRAIELMENEQFQSALAVLKNDLPSDQLEVQLAALSCYYNLGQLEEMEPYLTNLLNSKSPPSSVYHFKALASHQQHKYATAIEYYKLYLKNTRLSAEQEFIIKKKIKQCGTGIKWNFKDQLGYTENLGADVNSKYDDFAPVLSPNVNDRIYFSSNRVSSGWDEREDVPFSLIDIYKIEYQSDAWSDVQPFNPNAPSGENEILLDFDRTGQQAYILQDNHIVIDTFSVDGDVKKELFGGPVYPISGDNHLYWASEHVVLFTSSRPDGFGGYDLYLTSRDEFGVWGTPKNLGPSINTAADEISPFLSRDGSSLYFSSNRDNSLGGYDVFHSEFNFEDIGWDEPVNIYLPINSPSDDLHFRIASDGQTAYFSSDRKGGFGTFDLYAFYFKKPILEKMITQPLDHIDEWIDKTEDYVIDLNSAKKKIITVEVPYLLYDENDFILNPINIQKLNELVSLLKEDSDLQLDILCHSDDIQPFELDLFFSIKRAESVQDYLVDRGVDKERLFLVGVGKHYPMAANTINGVDNPSGKKFNRRIDFTLHTPTDKRYDLVYSRPAIVPQFQDTTYEEFSAIKNGLTYKIFIGSTNRPSIPEGVENYDFVTIEKDTKLQTYLYTVGNVGNYFDSNLLKLELREKGFTDATVYAYVHGRRLKENELEQWTSEYPDLIYFQYRGE